MCAAIAAIDELSLILDQEQIVPMYQPIVRMGSGEIFGYEGLIRGPAGSLLRSPARLFDAAHRAGRLAELERLCCRKVIEGYFRFELKERLFVNISPETVASGAESRELLQSLCQMP